MNSSDWPPCCSGPPVSVSWSWDCGVSCHTWLWNGTLPAQDERSLTKMYWVRRNLEFGFFNKDLPYVVRYSGKEPRVKSKFVVYTPSTLKVVSYSILHHVVHETQMHWVECSPRGTRSVWNTASCSACTITITSVASGGSSCCLPGSGSRQ